MNRQNKIKSRPGGGPKQASVMSLFGLTDVRKMPGSTQTSLPQSLSARSSAAVSPCSTGSANATANAATGRPGALLKENSFKLRSEGKLVMQGSSMQAVKHDSLPGSPAQSPAWWSRSSFSGQPRASPAGLIKESEPLLSSKRSSGSTMSPSLSQDSGSAVKRRSLVSTRAVTSRTATRSQSSGPTTAVGGAMSRTHANQVRQTASLSEQQQDVVDAVMTGANIFFTGAAGTGKSFLLYHIIRKLRSKYRYEEVAIVATTGLAALNIGGTTIHRWAGIGLGTESVDHLARKISRQGDSKRRWLNTKVLIMDEISMLDAELFEKLESLARKVRQINKPFGGIQLILTGDFFQLPPVVKSGGDARLCFEAKCWSETISKMMLLVKVFRQKEDDKLASMLNALREGNMTPETIADFKKLSRPIDAKDGIAPTELYPRREQVDRANKSKMMELKSRSFLFQAQDSASDERYDAGKLLENVMAPQMIELKVGAQVLLIQNKSAELVNGSRGTIKTFATETSHQELKIMNNLSGGAVYRLYNKVLDANGVLSDELSTEINEQLSDEQRSVMLRCFSDGPKYPVVDFGLAGEHVIEQAEFVISGPAPRYETIAKRVQVPLILSYALSIHKAQGQTISRLIVDLNKVFEKGQVYVAISRATHYDQLQVIGFDQRRVNVDSRVVEFYKTLSRLEKEDDDVFK